MHRYKPGFGPVRVARRLSGDSCCCLNRDFCGHSPSSSYRSAEGRAGFSPRLPVFDPKPSHAGFLVDKVVLGG
jgi:hypothetical protein